MLLPSSSLNSCRASVAISAAASASAPREAASKAAAAIGKSLDDLKAEALCLAKAVPSVGLEAHFQLSSRAKNSPET